jgi:hypothetical protein
MPRTPSADNTRANALLAFSKSFKKIKRAKTLAAQRKRRRRKKKRPRRSQTMPPMRTQVAQELLWAYLNDIDLCQPLSDQINAWENAHRIHQMSQLSIGGENPDRKRSSSLIPYTDKDKKKAPRPDQLQLIEREKIPLSEVYNRGKKV